MSPTTAKTSTLVGGVRILPLWKTKKLALYLVSQVIPCGIGLTIHQKKNAGSKPQAPEELLVKIGCLEMGNVEEEQVIFSIIPIRWLVLLCQKIADLRIFLVNVHHL